MKAAVKRHKSLILVAVQNVQKPNHTPDNVVREQAIILVFSEAYI